MKGPRCHDCGAEPGEMHRHGCDVERCPRCGYQKISCDCVYVVSGMDPATLEETHPDVYNNGPTAEMYAVWDRQWGPRRMPWTGEWPGTTECREYGFWCVGPPWVSVPAGTPGATEDLNRLVSQCVWDAVSQKFVIPESGRRK